MQLSWCSVQHGSCTHRKAVSQEVVDVQGAAAGRRLGWQLQPEVQVLLLHARLLAAVQACHLYSLPLVTTGRTKLRGEEFHSGVWLMDQAKDYVPYTEKKLVVTGQPAASRGAVLEAV